MTYTSFNSGYAPFFESPIEDESLSAAGRPAPNIPVVFPDGSVVWSEEPIDEPCWASSRSANRESPPGLPAEQPVPALTSYHVHHHHYHLLSETRWLVWMASGVAIASVLMLMVVHDRGGETAAGRSPDRIEGVSSQGP